MGLDGVELVMELEEAFGVELEDEALVELTTPRKAIDLILSRLETVQENMCLSQRAFYLLRRALTEHSGAAENERAEELFVKAAKTTYGDVQNAKRIGLPGLSVYSRGEKRRPTMNP